MWAACLMLFFAVSCTDEDIVSGSQDVVEGQPVTVSMKFASAMPKSVVITRADNSLSELSNLVIFIYSNSGDFQKVVSTSATNQDDRITLGTSTSDPETADNMIYPVTFNTTSGTKKLLAVANTSSVADGGGFWESLSGIVQSAQSGNLDFDELKASVISLRDDYKGESVQTIQITSDSQMLLTGWNDGVIFNTNGQVFNYGTDGDQSNQVVIKLDRSMARITFNIAESTPGVNGAKGIFIPSSYRVYNVPVNSYLTNKEHTAVPSGESAFEFANTAPATIGNVNDGQYSFTFYMPENIYATVEGVSDYADRDKWNGTGENSGAQPEDKNWTKAPQTSTFVVISGTYTETTAEEGGHNYTGSVEYTVHLGNFSDAPDAGGSMGDFSVERNCSYTYNMSVLGVDNIVVEAQTEKDDDDSFQQGAEGDIYSYDDVTYSYQLDAHYEQVYLQYNLSSIAQAVRSSLSGQSNPSDEDIGNAIAEQLILVIQSEAMDYIHEESAAEPYTVRNKRGTLMPYKIYADAVRDSQDPTEAKEAILKGAGEGIVPTKGFDYKWVEFWPQSVTTIAKYPGVSDWSKENLNSGFANDDPYGGRASGHAEYLLDVYDVIVKMGKVVRKIYDNESISLTARGEDGITVTNTGYYNANYVARFTAFVNEYYYYKHPLTGAKVTSWSVFTNKIPREMIITMNSDVSNDGNSTYNQLYSYISQLSMQTFYNSREMQLDAFGIETYNETPLCYWGGGNNYNASTTEGRRNQLSLINGNDEWSYYINYAYNGWTSSVTTERSRHKLDHDVYERGSERNPTYAYYACLSRNRDLNGDGTISSNEVRWYLPSVNEYIRTSIGNNAISNSSQLYFGDKTVMNSNGYPEEYIQDGSLYYTSSSSNERVFWAVERGSYGPINLYSEGGVNDGWEHEKKPIRCIRLLPGEKGGDHDISSDDVYSADATYEMQDATGRTPIVLNFKGRLVSELYRERAEGSLNRHTEDDDENSFYQGIFVANEFLNDTYTLASIVGLRITNNSLVVESNSRNNPCRNYNEKGYDNWRVPNLVELSAMNAAGLLDACQDADGQRALCATQFSNLNVRYGFARSGLIYCPGGSGTSDINLRFKIRCVRDVPANFNLDN